MMDRSMQILAIKLAESELSLAIAQARLESVLQENEGLKVEQAQAQAQLEQTQAELRQVYDELQSYKIAAEEEAAAEEEQGEENVQDNA